MRPTVASNRTVWLVFSVCYVYPGKQTTVLSESASCYVTCSELQTKYGSLPTSVNLQKTFFGLYALTRILASEIVRKIPKFRRYGMIYSIAVHMEISWWSQRGQDVKRPLKKQLARSPRVKSNYHDSGQQPLLRLPLAAFDDLPWFNCNSCHYPGSSVCKKPMA